MTELALATQLDLARQVKGLVLNSVQSQNSKNAYEVGLDEFIAWFQRTQPASGFSRATVLAYRSFLIDRGYAPSTINLKLTALRRLAAEAAENGLLTQEVAASILRIKGVPMHGRRIGNWLTVRQAEDFVTEPDTTTLKGKRDRAILMVMIGCGLRRNETASLTIEHIQQRESRWVIVDLIGKGGRVRSVPMPSWTKAAIDAWVEAAEIKTGRLFLPVNKSDRIFGNGKMGPEAIFAVVKRYSREIGIENFAPHDVRRTYAKLSHKGRAPLEQIQLSLGHQSIVTTERYLGIEQDFTDAPCDHLGMKVQING